jgi:hypothetical protein
MMYYAKRTEPQLWTVGIDTPDGWHPVMDFDSRADAEAHADRRNGISNPVSSDVVGRLDRLERLVETLAGHIAMLQEDTVRAARVVNENSPDFHGY